MLVSYLLAALALGIDPDSDNYAGLMTPMEAWLRLIDNSSGID
jgi:hypothetical protein